jgi:acetyl esterase
MLDPAAKSLIELIAKRKLPSYDQLSPVDAREYYRERRFLTQPEPQQVESVETLLVPGPHGDIPVRAYRPQGSTAQQILRPLVYYHGGGHTIGDLDTHDTLCRELCNKSGYAVFSVDYRLGPEHKFPAAVDDSWSALQWIASNAADVLIDAEQLAVGGDSAGANLAAVMALTARDKGGPRIVYQLLIYPVTDFRYATASQKSNGAGYLLTREVIDYFTANYLPSDANRLDWRISPALASDFSGLPPALVLTAGYDPLLDEGREYADKLQAGGTQVEYVCYPGQIHGFITMGRAIPQANEAVALCADRLRRLGR